METPSSSSIAAASAPEKRPAAGAPAPSSDHPRRGLGERILKAGGLVFIPHVGVRLSGVLVSFWIANKYNEAVSDVFIMVSNVVLNAAFQVGEQCLGPAYLPVFASAREADGEARAWHYTSVLFNVQAVLLVVVVGFMMLFPKLIVNTFTQWNSRNIELRLTDETRLKTKVVTDDEDGYVVRVLEGSIPSGYAERSLKTETAKEEDPPLGAQSIGALQFLPRSSVDNCLEIDKELAGRIERRDIAYRMLPWSALGLIGMSLASLTYVLLNAYKEFFWAAFGDTAQKIVILAGALGGTIIGKGDWRYIAGGIVLGGTIKLIVHVGALGFVRMKQYRLTFNVTDAYVRAFFIAVAPLVVGIFISQVRDFVMQYILTAKGGLPTYFKFGKGIVDVITFLVPYTLSIALLPYFCDISARNDNKHLGEVLSKIIRMLTWFFVPLSIVLAASALPVCLTVYSGKNIQLQESQYSAAVAQVFCVLMTFMAVEQMVMQAFFSSRRTMAPTIAGLIFSILTAAVAYVLVMNGTVTSVYAILMTVALCLALARALKVVLLVLMLKTTVPVLPFAETIGFVGQLAVASAAAVAVSFGTAHVFESTILPRFFHNGRAGNIVEAVAIGLAGGAIYLAFSLLLKMEEPRECLQWAREKLKRRGAKVEA